MLPERTIVAWRAAASNLARSPGEKPVVPITCTIRACAASTAKAMLVAGVEKSMMPSASTTEASASSVTVTPAEAQPASVPTSCPSAGELARSSAPESTRPSVSPMRRTIVRPMRPAAPTTTSRMSAIEHRFP